MPVEFLGIAATNDGSETTARSGGSFDKDYTLRLARAHEENGWDRVLFAYGSGSPDPNAAAAYIASETEKMQLLLAHRPNVSYPTFAAKTFATIEQISAPPGSAPGSSSRPGRPASCSTMTDSITTSPISSATCSRCRSPGHGCRSAGPPPLPTRPAAPRVTYTACGGGPSPAPPSRSSR